MISVVILTWNSRRYIQECLEALVVDLQEVQKEFEIFVVDNGSTDSTRKVLKEFELRGLVSVILLEKNYGTTYARNIALKKARGEYLFIIDSDAKVMPGTIHVLLEVL